jgi:hypothetical protein
LSLFNFITDRTRLVGISIKDFIGKLNPQSVAIVAITLLFSLISTVFAVLPYYKDSGNSRISLGALGIPWQQEKFFESIRLGDTEAVDLFLAGGMDPNTPGADRQLPIFLAQNRANSKAILDRLLKFGLNVNGAFRASNGTNYPLSWAIFEKNVPLVRALLESGARTDAELASHVSAGIPIRTPLSEAQEQAQSPQASAESVEICKLVESASRK